MSQFKAFSYTRRSPLGCGGTGLPGSVIFLRSALDALSAATHASRTAPAYLARARTNVKKKQNREEMAMRTSVCERRTVYTTTGRIAMPRVNIATTRVTVVTPIGFWLSRDTLKIFLDSRILIQVRGTGVATAVTVAVAVTIVHRLLATTRVTFVA